LLGRLTALEELRCDTLEVSAVLRLPPSLQALSATFESADADFSTSCCLDLRHLTRLRTLGCLDDCDVRAVLDVLLPPQLTNLSAAAPLSQLTGATSLRFVQLCWCNIGLLPKLSKLAGPWELSLYN
jgi:hypothetical protein